MNVTHNIRACRHVTLGAITLMSDYAAAAIGRRR